MRLLIALSFLLVCAPVAGATSARVEGATLLDLDPPVAKLLRVSGSGGAEAYRRRVALPAIAGSAGASWRIAHRGELALRRGSRSVAIEELEVQASRRGVAVRGRVTGRVVTLLRGSGRPKLSARSAVVRGGAVRAAPALRALVRRRLGVTLPPVVGRLQSRARLVAGASAVVVLPARPAGAVDVTGGSVAWHIRESFVQYLNAGEGVRVSGGAVAGAPTRAPGSDAELVYDVSLPVRGGWQDPETGRTLLQLGGAVNFSYKAHGIDLTVRDGAVELGGGGPERASFLFEGEAGEDFSGTRIALLDLAVARARERRDDGRTLVEVPGLVPRAQTVFSGFYAAGDPFGWMTIGWTQG